ncbi:MAG: hypothetical protein HS117_24590 [Verrucomicrobiaceae bacterium]|nr:hypothetical protein [Verrucomicrobiaceae bacterium]
MDKGETTLQDALRSRTFENLAIKRINQECSLVVTVNGSARVLTNEDGGRMKFRHAWQVREWLQRKFQITEEAIPVETYR